MSAILLISPEPWAGHFVSKHHYAVELASRGHQVLYAGPPERGCEPSLESVAAYGVSLQVVHADRLAPGLRFFPAALRQYVERQWLQRLEELVGAHVDVVWLFENSRFFDMRFAGTRLKIYHQVDLNQDFHPDTAAATADLAIAASKPIHERLKGSARSSLRLTHGYRAPDETKPPAIRDQRFHRSGLNAMLIGNLEIAYLDVELLADLVRDAPEVQFHFVGNYSAGKGLHGTLGAAENAVFWGAQPAERLPELLACADILLVAYYADGHLQQLANPHKIMEYLAAGCVVLATRTLEYEEHTGLVEIADGRASYRERFRSLVADIDIWNQPALVRRRQAYANDHTYARQVDRIAHALGERGTLLA